MNRFIVFSGQTKKLSVQWFTVDGRDEAFAVIRSARPAKAAMYADAIADDRKKYRQIGPMGHIRHIGFGVVKKRISTYGIMHMSNKSYRSYLRQPTGAVTEQIRRQTKGSRQHHVYDAGLTELYRSRLSATDNR